MFTGIITDIGEVSQIETQGDTRFKILCTYPARGIDIGASIACSGACLTVTDRGMEGDRTYFTIDASAETLSKTSLGDWTVGRRINLERALKMGDELGGHIVTGHVDGVGTVVSATPERDSLRLVFDAPAEIGPYAAPKGSITIDGVSLTVNEVEDHAGGTRFGVNIIPHTQSQTTLGALTARDRVNLEIDVLARYVARLEQARTAAGGKARA